MDHPTDNSDSVSIIPEYTVIKKVILQQYYTSQNLLSTYDLKPTLPNEKRLRQSLIDLSRSLSFKTYVLEDKKLKDFFSYFLSHPYEFQTFSLHTVYAICHLIIEILGLTKIESEDVSKENVYLEV